METPHCLLHTCQWKSHTWDINGSSTCRNDTCCGKGPSDPTGWEEGILSPQWHIVGLRKRKCIFPEKPGRMPSLKKKKKKKSYRFQFLPFPREKLRDPCSGCLIFAQQCQMLASVCSPRTSITARIWHNIGKSSYFCLLWCFWTFTPNLLPWSLNICLVRGQLNTECIAIWKLLLQNTRLNS